MYKIFFNRVSQVYELTEMARMFLPSSEFCILDRDPAEDEGNAVEDVIIRLLIRSQQETKANGGYTIDLRNIQDAP